MNAKESKIKNNTKIVVIEGLWNTGKTTLCRFLEKYNDFYFIQEPNHVKSGIIKKSKEFITNWYFEEHLKNLILGFKMVDDKTNVVIERSPISNIAFTKTSFKNLDSYKNKFTVIEKLLIEIKNNSNMCPIFIFLTPKNIKLLSQRIYNSKDKYIKIYSDENLLKNCDKYIFNFLQHLNRKNLIKLIVEKTDKFTIKNIQNIISKIL